MRSSCGLRITLSILCTFNFVIHSLNKPSTLPYWYVIAFYVRETHVIHHQEDLVQEDVFISRRQAKKMTPQVAWRPPTPHRNEGSGCLVSFRCRVR